MPHIPLRYRLRALMGVPVRRRLRRARSAVLQIAEKNCRHSQQTVLQDLLRLNAGTSFSRDFGLEPGLKSGDFRRRVPVAGYDAFKPYIDRVAAGDHRALLGSANRLLMLATTSGTTSASKLIPVTSRFLSDYRRGWQIWGIGTYSDHPLLQKLNIVQIASSHRKSHTSDGTPCGNISGLVAAMQSPIVRSLYTIPAAVAEIGDADTRRLTIARLSLCDPWTGAMITANPSSLVQLAELVRNQSGELIEAIARGGIHLDDAALATRLNRLRALAPNPSRARELSELCRASGRLEPGACWPMLKLLGVWCGGSAAAYLPRLKQLFGNIPVRDHGLHASEGRMTLPLADESPSGVLEVWTHYFEFMPVRESDSAQPVILEAHELEEGQEYFILLTTSSGLCRYNIQDVVRCTGWYGSTPTLEFLHKGSHMSSITGEKISESQVVESVRAAAARHHVLLRTFTMTPVWGSPPGYSLFVGAEAEMTSPAAGWLHLAEAVESELGARNSEYLEKRTSGRLAPLAIQVIDETVWRQFTMARLNGSGGSAEQYKHPCLLPDPQFRNLFRKLSGLDNN